MKNGSISYAKNCGEGWHGRGAPHPRAALRARMGRSRDRTPPLLEWKIVGMEMLP